MDLNKTVSPSRSEGRPRKNEGRPQRAQTTQRAALGLQVRNWQKEEKAAKTILPVMPVLAVVSVLLLSGCGPFLAIDVFVVGERTSLEKQVLGNYQALSADFEAFGSVRGVDELGRIRQPPPISDSKQAAILAMQNRAYNRDDVTTFLSEGHVGEGNRGLLTIFEDKLDTLAPPRREFLRAVVAEENADRETLIERLMRTTPGVTAEDEGRVRALFASLNRDTAPPAAAIQAEDGTWSTK